MLNPILAAALLSQPGAMSPDSLVLGQFRRASVVLLGEDHGVREHLLFVQSLIPKLYKEGVRNVGMEFGAAENQADLDRLVNGAVYDAAAARRIMFSYNTLWPYQEYMDMYRAAWSFNRSLPKGAPRFRILNLSYRFDWHGSDGSRGIEQDRKIFPKGPVDRFRAERILTEVVSKGQKILCLVGTPHAFTRFRMRHYDYQYPNFTRYEDGWLGTELKRKLGPKARNLLFHQPFGKASEEAETLAKGPQGFDLAASPLGRVAVKYPEWDPVADPATPFRAFADGYVFLAPLKSLHGATVDRAFIDDRNWAEAVANMPDPNWHKRPANREDYWKLVESFVDLKSRYGATR